MKPPTLAGLLDDVELGGYPNRPIGGDNPYRCCYYCELSAPQINNRLGGHREYCEWALEQKARIVSGVVLDGVSEKNLEIARAIRDRVDGQLNRYREKRFPNHTWAEHERVGVGFVMGSCDGDFAQVSLMLCNGNVWSYPMSEVRPLGKNDRHKIGYEMRWRVLTRFGCAKGGFMGRGTGFTQASRKWDANKEP